MKTLISHSLEETQNIAIAWLKELVIRQNNLDKAVVVGLSGHLGAGKTAFVKLIAKELGVVGTVTSPTFVIMKIYPTNLSSSILNNIEGRKFERLVHIDAYRLEKAGELEVLNLHKLIEDKNNLIMVEWPENVGLKTDLQINMKATNNEGVFEIDML